MTRKNASPHFKTLFFIFVIIIVIITITYLAYGYEVQAENTCKEKGYIRGNGAFINDLPMRYRCFTFINDELITKWVQK